LVRLQLALPAALLGMLGVLLAQRGFVEYPDEEVNPAPIPPGAFEKTEWAFARLRYPTGGGFARWRPYGTWAMDYPKADRQFIKGVKRLTRLHARSSEQVVDLSLEDEEIFNWPWIYAIEVGQWDLTERQAKLLREYLLRGGFLMTDDFHGTLEWNRFAAVMSRVFPDRPIIEIEDKDPIFHVLYDVGERIQVPGIATFGTGVTYERDGVIPHWRGIYDDHGRIMVAICFNQDNGDAWEWADSAEYPYRPASQAYQLGINFIVYAMTH
jgi:hypothetical protein